MARKKNSTWQWILVILCGAAVLVSGLFLFYQELVRYDRTATATVRNEYFSPDYSPYYSYGDFTDAEGNPYSAFLDSGRERYPYEDGDTVEILYNSADPNISTAKDLWHVLYLVLRLGIPAAALIAIIRAIRGLQKAKEEDPKTQQNR